MAKEHSERHLTRRDFLRQATVGALLGASAAASASVTHDKQGADCDAAAVCELRRLGRTDLQVYPLGLGAGGIKEPAVARRALDLGVSYFDTAEGYQDGESEVKLGEALKGRRDDAIVATKWGWWGKETADDYIAACEASLKRLGMDHVDIIQLHGVGRPEHVTNEAAWEAFNRLKEAGKARFNGISMHENQVAVVEAVIESGRFDQVLLVYHAMNAEQMAPMIRKAHEAGIGVVAMKGLAPVHEGKDTDAFAGLPGNPYQQAIQWVLKDESVATLIVNMPTFEELAENIAAATGEAGHADLSEFEEAAKRISVGSCHMCGACTGQCPAGVRVADIMRYRLYHDGYGDRGRARELYHALPAEASAAACGDCAECRIVCPWGVPVRPRLESMHVRLA